MTMETNAKQILLGNLRGLADHIENGTEIVDSWSIDYGMKDSKYRLNVVTIHNPPKETKKIPEDTNDNLSNEPD